MTGDQEIKIPTSFEEAEDDLGGNLTEEKAPVDKPEKEEVQEPEDKGAEVDEPKGEKEEKKKSEDQEEEKFKLFDDDGDDEPNEVFQSISKEFDIEVENLDDLKSYVSSLKEGFSETAFANDEIKELNEYVKNGGSISKAKEVKAKVSDLKEEVGKYEAAISNLDSVVSLSDKAKIKSFLQRYYERFLGMDREAVQQNLTDIDNLFEEERVSAVRTELIRAQRDWKSTLSLELKERKGLLEKAEADASKMINDAEVSKKNADKAFSKAVDAFTDSDGKRFTRKAKWAAKSAYNTKPMETTIPSGFAERFFTTDGKFDAEKAIKNLALIENYDSKMSEIEKRVKAGAFRDLQDYQSKKKSKGEAATAREVGDGEDLGGSRSTQRGVFEVRK